MSIESTTSDLVLRQSKESGPLMPTSVMTTLGRIAKKSPERGLRAMVRGRYLRVARDLDVDDDACTAIVLAFEGQGELLRGSARGPSAVLVEWTFHTLADVMKCSLHDPQTESPIAPSPENYRSDALAYLETYEIDIEEARRRGAKVSDPDLVVIDGREFMEWLASEQQIAFTEDSDATSLAAFGESLPTKDANALYEQLLDHDDIDDVFVSESELAFLLDRFRARSIRRMR